MRVVILCLALLFASGAAAERAELLPDPHFVQDLTNWYPKGATLVREAGPDGGPAVRISGVPEGEEGWRHLGAGLQTPPTGRPLVFTVTVRGEADQTFQINLFSYDAEGGTAYSASNPQILRDDAWTERTVIFTLPETSHQLQVWVVNPERRELWVADPSLIDDDAPAAVVQRTRLSGHGVLTATAAVDVGLNRATGAETGKVLFPVPNLAAHQVPLDFTVATDPPAALWGVRWIEREDGRNLLAEVEVAPISDVTRVRWISRVLVADVPPRELPPADAPEITDANRAWLRATACVQADDADVAALADSLKAAHPRLDDYVTAVTDWVARNRGDGAPFRTLDAAAAVHCGGSCTSRANLNAALLRAGGVPARTQAHLPTWSGPLYEHWLVEYWHPGAGWTWIESTLGRLQPNPNSLVAINTANPGDEDQGFDPILAWSGVMAGAPRYAVHELDRDLVRHRARADNWATVSMDLSAAYPRTDALFEAARARFEVLRAALTAGVTPSIDSEALDEVLDGGDPDALLAWLR